MLRVQKFVETPKFHLLYYSNTYLNEHLNIDAQLKSQYDLIYRQYEL